MPRSTLFDIESRPPVPASDRPDPMLWIRRLSVIDKLSMDHRIVRSVPFRRGLNIVNTKVHPGNKETSTVGHSVGKSLMTRLIRYCLGEQGFGDRIIRQSICDFLPHGYVMAEIDIVGETWFIARPVGVESSRMSWAAQDGLSAIVDESKRINFTSFIEYIYQAVLGSMPTIQLPHAKRSVSWVDSVGWLAPDQACAHKSHVEWRPGGSSSSSRGLKIEDNHIVIRTLMDLLGSEDSEMITKHKNLLSQQGRMGHQIELAEAINKNMRDRLRNRLAGEIAEIADLDGELLAGRILEFASKQRESLERLLREIDDPVPKWANSNNDLQKKIGAAEQSRQREINDREVAEAQLEMIQDDSNELARNAAMGNWCNLFLTRDEAVSRGCPGVGDDEPGLMDPRKSRKVADYKATIVECSKRIENIDAQLVELNKQAEVSKCELQKARETVANRIDPLKARIDNYVQLEREAQTFLTSLQKTAKMIEEWKNLKPEIKSSLKLRHDADLRYQKNRETLSQHFCFAVSELTGRDVSGSIEINANGIFPRVKDDARSRGEALGTTEVLAFDLGCLAASIEGLGFHPRFIVHDSPRDADMEEPLYHRLFEFVAGLEDAFGSREPSFQYIITTTTMPPDEIVKSNKKFVRLTLDKRIKDGLLLCENF